MAADPSLFLVFNMPAYQQWAADAVAAELAAAGVRRQAVFVADPPKAGAPWGCAAADAGGAAAMRNGSVAIADMRGPLGRYKAAVAAGAIRDGGQRDPAIWMGLGNSHWGPPLQAALVRHVLTLVAVARHRADMARGAPEGRGCGPGAGAQ